MKEDTEMSRKPTIKKQTPPKLKLTRAEKEENWRRYQAMTPAEKDAAHARALRGEYYFARKR
jgi:hypothetical protein